MAKTMRSSRQTLEDPTALGRQFKKRLQGHDVLVGGTVLEYLRPSLVKVYRRAGYDFIYAESEHAHLLLPQFSDFVLSARDNGIPMIAKTGQLERPEVARLLDAGVVGIQLPRTESRDEVLELLQYMKFPPNGTRAGAPCYGNVDYAPPGDDAAYMKRADEATVLVVHIETKQGYENADEIVSTPGVDMVYVGPYDFSISMGHPGEYDHPQVRGPMQEILELCRKHKVPFGTSASGDKAAAAWVRKGCRFFELPDEITLIAQGATNLAAAYSKMPRSPGRA